MSSPDQFAAYSVFSSGESITTFVHDEPVLSCRSTLNVFVSISKTDADCIWLA